MDIRDHFELEDNEKQPFDKFLICQHCKFKTNIPETMVNYEIPLMAHLFVCKKFWFWLLDFTELKQKQIENEYKNFKDQYLCEHEFVQKVGGKYCGKCGIYFSEQTITFDGEKQNGT